MQIGSATATSTTLLGRLRCQPADQEAWKEFVWRYGPRIFQWCGKWNLQEADAQDVTQCVLLKLANKMQAFQYDPSRSFRGWLRTLTMHALSDFLQERQRCDPQALHALSVAAARDSLLHDLEEEFDRELLEKAMTRVRQRLSPNKKWQAFELTALEGLSGSEAAARLQMKVATVFTAKSKVQQLLQKEVQKLEALERE
jgi:RNA polymerase sigma factor (sigma-70 family)